MRGRQASPSGTSTFACPGSSRLGARRPNNGTRGLLLLHDHASAHIATATLDYLEANRVQLVTQTWYSLSLAPSNFFLFQGDVDAQAFFEGVTSEMPQSK